MRRMISATLAVLAVSVLLMVPATPASANASVPVQAFPWAPSAFVAGTSIAPPAPPVDPNDIDEWNRYRLQDRNYRRQLIDQARERNWTPRTAPQPVSPPKTPTRGPVGGPLGLAMLAPLIIEGGLEIIAVSKEGQELGLGENAEEIICSGIGPTDGDWFLSLLYGTHDCGMTITEPNLGVVAGPNYLEGGGLRLDYKGCNPASCTVGGSLPVDVCFARTGALAAGWVVQALNYGAQNWTSTNVSGGSICASTFGGSEASTALWYINGPSGTNQARLQTQGSLRLFQQSTGTVIEMTMHDPDPVRQPRCRVGWSDGSETVADGEALYRESEGLPISSRGLGCEQAYAQRPSPGVMPDWVKIESEDDGGATTEIATMPVPSEVEKSKPSEGLKLARVIGTEVRSCMTWEVDCADWWEESDEGTSTEKFRCTWGGVDIDLAECGIYRDTFKNPNNVTISDPVTGAQTPWTLQPGTGNSLSPGVGPGAGAAPADRCFESGWASVANPIDWVLVPVKCALVWAFVPRTSVLAETVNGLGVAAGDVAAVDALAALVAELPGSGGCGGLPFDLVFFGQSFHGALLEACDGPERAAAVVVNGLLTLSIVTGALLAITRYMAAVFGFVGAGGSIEQTQRATEREIARMGGGGRGGD